VFLVPAPRKSKSRSLLAGRQNVHRAKQNDGQKFIVWLCVLLFSVYNQDTMLSVQLLLVAAAALTLPASAENAPFYWQDAGQDYLSSYIKSGKMEQLGRTGVAAMHAVLIRYV
jgi:hypothetical protein